MTSKSVAIETTVLGKKYGRRAALTNCSLSVPEGHVVGLVGPNGADKSTLLHLAVGLLEPTTGDISVLGDRPRTDRLRAFRLYAGRIRGGGRATDLAGDGGHVGRSHLRPRGHHALGAVASVATGAQVDAVEPGGSGRHRNTQRWSAHLVCQRRDAAQRLGAVQSPCHQFRTSG